MRTLAAVLVLASVSGCGILGPDESDLAGNWTSPEANIRMGIKPIADPAKVEGTATLGTTSGSVSGSVAGRDVTLGFAFCAGGIGSCVFPQFYGRLEAADRLVGEMGGGRVVFRRGN